MTSIKPGCRYVYKDTGQPVTVTEVTERDVLCVFDYGDGKCGVVLGHESAANSLCEYKPPKE